MLPSRNMDITEKVTNIKNHSLLDVEWQEPRGHQFGRVEHQEHGSMTGEEAGLHLDGVQSKVKDGTLLWSETPGFLSYHVVLEPQRKQ